MGKPWPLDTHEKLVAAGYVFDKEGPCKSPDCKTPIRWYTTPNARLMPFEGIGGGRLQPHFASCVDARKFTRRGGGEAA